MVRIALNGFGRIGRNFLRTFLVNGTPKDIEFVAINLGPADPKNLVYSVKYDTLMGAYHGNVSYANGTLSANGLEIEILTETDVTKLPWKKLNIDWVIDATGKFTQRKQAQKHLDAGAKKVLITAPATDEDITLIPGVNDQQYKPEHKIVSLGSCTTNALAPVVHILHQKYTISQASLTTIHAYTNSQVLLDVENKKTRLSRAAAVNMIPSSTGATEVIGKIFPDLQKKFVGNSIRIPLTKVSLIDVVAMVQKPTTKEEINAAFADAAKKHLAGILDITHEPLVSSDFNNNPYSVIVDGLLTHANGNLVKVFGWYDNEWAYSLRLKEVLQKYTH